MKKIKSNKIETKSFLDFKSELEKIINTCTIDDFEIEIGIPKWSVYAPIKVEGTYNDYNFKGTIKGICKWHEYESYYEDINDFYKDIVEMEHDKLNMGFIYELTENGNFDFDIPIDNYDFSKLKWDTNTPDEIKIDFEDEDFEEICEVYEGGDQIEPKIKYFKVELKSMEEGISFELIWKTV